MSSLEALEAEALGEFVVDGERLAAGDRLHRHVEIGRLAGERAERVILGEGRVDDALVARRDADELVLEAGDERSGAEDDLDVLALAALERIAVDRAVEIDGDPVAGARRSRRRAGRYRCAGSSAMRSIAASTSSAVNVGDWTLERDVVEVAELELRQHFQRDLESEIAVRLESGLDRRLVGRQFDLRLAGEPQAVVVDDLLVGACDRLLHDVGHHRAAVDLAADARPAPCRGGSR